MKRRILFLVACLAGCSIVDPVSSIRQTLNRQADAWSAGDLDGFMAAYWHSDDLTFAAFPRTTDPRTATQPSITRGWNAVATRYRSRYKNAAEMGKLFFRGLDIRPVDDRSAVVTGKYELFRNGEALTGFFVLDLVRQPDGWKIVRDRTYPD